jgi:hypothetical protein
MTLRKALTWALIAAVAIAALALLAACGDDDSSKSSSSTSTSGSSGQTNGGTGNDTQYVASICKAAAKFSDDLTAASKSDPSKLADPTAAESLFEKPLQDYVNSLKQAKPPSDVKTFHDAFVKALDDALTNLKKTHDISAFESLGNDLPTPSASLSDRLNAAAKNNADCTKAGLNFSGN